MPVKTYKTKDEIPQAQRDKALELKDGTFAVDEPVDVEALKAEGQRAIEAERQKAKDEERARKAAEKERDELKQKKEAADRGISEAELQKIKDAEAAARKPIEDENAKLKAENDRLKRTDKVRTVGLAKGLMEDRIEDAMLALESRTRLGDQGNIIVRDKNGVDTTESLEDFLEKTFKKEKPWLYKGPGGSGGGADSSSDGGGGKGGYDPVAEGKKIAEQQKGSVEQRKLART